MRARRVLHTRDTHTEGVSAQIVVGGVGEIPGDTMMERRLHFIGHHDDIRPEFIYTVLVAAADAASASRPGARRENLERYVKRLEELEAMACGFPGVSNASAVQAGREIRVIVDSNRINDREAAKLSKELAKSIEDNLTYPGEVKVVVLRETKVVEFAR